MISKQEYLAQAAAGYNRIPLVQELLADLDTPLSIYLKLANRPYTYLLESVVGGERFGRYSFVGLGSNTYIKASGREISLYEDGVIIEQHRGNPLDLSKPSTSVSTRPKSPVCRASPAASSAISATKPSIASNTSQAV